MISKILQLPFPDNNGG